MADDQDKSERTRRMVPGDTDQAVHDLLDRAEEAGLESSDLEEIVHELAASIAADVNNEGLEGQLKYLIDQMGVQGTTKQLLRLVDERSETADHE